MCCERNFGLQADDDARAVPIALHTEMAALGAAANEPVCRVEDFTVLGGANRHRAVRETRTF